MPDSIDFKFRAFLSYSHTDTLLAKWLHKRLEGFPLRGLAGRDTPLGPVRLAATDLPRPRRLQRGPHAERTDRRRARRLRRTHRAVLARLGGKSLRERGNPPVQASPPRPADCARDRCDGAGRSAGQFPARAEVRAGRGRTGHGPPRRHAAGRRCARGSRRPRPRAGESPPPR